MSTEWMIQSKQDEWMFWTEANEGGWVEMDSADSFDEGEKVHFHLPLDGQWIEAFYCDACGDLRPDYKAETEMGWFNAASIDPPENYWYCAMCAGAREDSIVSKYRYEELK